MVRNFILYVCILFTCSCCNFFSTGTNDDKIIEAAKRIETLVSKGDVKSLSVQFDLSSFEKRCLAKINKEGIKRPINPLNEGYRSGAISSIEGFFDELIQSVNQGGYFRMARYYFDKKSYHIVFSCYTSVGVKFIDFEMSSSDPSLIMDYYDFYLGEEFSTTYSGHILNQLRHGVAKGEYAQTREDMERIERYANGSKFEDAWTLVNQIPEKFNLKSVQKMRVVLSKNISEKTYEETLKDFIRSDSSEVRFVSYQSMNLYFLLKEYDKALKEIDILRSIVGHDIMFDLLEGDCLRGIGEYAKAVAKYDSIIANYPELYHPYYYKIESLVKAGKSEEASQVIKTIKTVFNLADQETSTLRKQL